MEQQIERAENMELDKNKNKNIHFPLRFPNANFEIRNSNPMNIVNLNGSCDGVK